MPVKDKSKTCYAVSWLYPTADVMDSPTTFTVQSCQRSLWPTATSNDSLNVRLLWSKSGGSGFHQMEDTWKAWCVVPLSLWWVAYLEVWEKKTTSTSALTSCTKCPQLIDKHKCVPSLLVCSTHKCPYAMVQCSVKPNPKQTLLYMAVLCERQSCAALVWVTCRCITKHRPV